MRQIILAIWLAFDLLAQAGELHYAPIENLERIDVQTLNSAHRTIDLAAYS